MTEDAAETDDEAVYPTLDLDSSIKLITLLISHLDKDENVSVGLFLCFQLTQQLNLGDTKAAELAAMMIGRSDKAVHEWRSQFFENNGEIPESKQGKYQRSGILWPNEDLNKKATRFIRENANVKG